MAHLRTYNPDVKQDRSEDPTDEHIIFEDTIIPGVTSMDGMICLGTFTNALDDPLIISQLNLLPDEAEAMANVMLKLVDEIKAGKADDDKNHMPTLH